MSCRGKAPRWPGVVRLPGVTDAAVPAPAGPTLARLLTLTARAVQAVRSGRSLTDVLAGVRQQLQSVQAKNPQARIMDGRFMVIAQGIALPQARVNALGYLNAFIEDAKTSGVVAQAIERLR